MIKAEQQQQERLQKQQKVQKAAQKMQKKDKPAQAQKPGSQEAPKLESNQPAQEIEGSEEKPRASKQVKIRIFLKFKLKADQSYLEINFYFPQP